MSEGFRQGPLISLLLLICGLAAAQQEELLRQAESTFRAGELDRASELASRVAESNPRSVQAHIILGVIAAQRSRWEEAARRFETVIKLAPSNPHGYFYLGQANLYQQRWDQAIGYFEKALSRSYPDRTRLSIELALAQNEAGRPAQALATLEKISPPDAAAIAAKFYAIRAFSYAALGESKLATESIRHAKDRDGSNPEYSSFLISTLLDMDQPGLALSEAMQAQKKFPDHADIQFAFGLAAYHVTQGEFTRIALRNLTEAAPDNPKALLLSGLVHRQNGDTENATRAFVEAAKRGVPDAHLLLGLVYKEAGDHAAAERELLQAERLNPGSAQTALELGKLLLTRGDLDAALTRLKKAEQHMPATAAVHYQLGIIYRRLGQEQESEQHFGRYRELLQSQAEKK